MRPAWSLLLAASLAATGLAAWQASSLRVETRLLDLLPEGAPATAAYRDYLETFGGIQRVEVVLVPAPGAGTSAASAGDLAAAAAALAEDLIGREGVASARSGLDPEDEAFVARWVLPRLALLPAVPAEEVRARLRPEAAAARGRHLRARLLGPAGGLEARLSQVDPLALAGEEGALPGAGALGTLDPATGAFLAPGGGAALVLVTPEAAELDPGSGRKLRAAIAAACAAAQAQVDAPVACHAAGGPLYAAEDEEAIRGDIIRTVSGSALAITVILVLFFRGVALPAALVLTVAAGVVWTGGLVSLARGGVSVVGVAFGSILLGLGVDYGVHGVVRFRGERLAGRGPEEALAATLRRAGPAILASAATTAGAFLVLLAAGFPPVAELGAVVATGILAILAATAAVGAPALMLGASLERRRARSDGLLWVGAGRGVDALVGLAGRRPLAVLLLAAVVTAVTLAAATHMEFGSDLRVLRPDGRPSAQAEGMLVEHFDWGRDAFTILVPAADLDAALDRSRAVQARLAGVLPGAAVRGPGDWLAGGDLLRQRLVHLSGPETASGVEALRRGLAEAGFRLERFAAPLQVLDTIAAGEAPPPVPPEAWPDWLRELIRVDRSGAVAALHVRASGVDWGSDAGRRIQEAVAAASPGAVVAAAPLLAVELQDHVAREFGRLSLWAALLVAVMILVSLRGSIRGALLALLPVTAGCVWTLGLLAASGLALNPVSAALATLLLGIGIDDGLHVLHGRRHHASLAAAARAVGRPMLLTTATTCVGFGSLALSRVPALRHAGILVALGAVLCLVATLLLLPALEAAARRGRGPA